MFDLAIDSKLACPRLLAIRVPATNNLFQRE